MNTADQNISMRYAFRLYVAGSAPNSVRARANLKAICQTFSCDEFELEVVDVLNDPQRALDDGVLITPTLTKLSPGPIRKIIGNLDDQKMVAVALGLHGGDDN